MAVDQNGNVVNPQVSKLLCAACMPPTYGTLTWLRMDDHRGSRPHTLQAMLDAIRGNPDIMSQLATGNAPLHEAIRYGVTALQDAVCFACCALAIRAYVNRLSSSPSLLISRTGRATSTEWLSSCARCTQRARQKLQRAARCRIMEHMLLSCIKMLSTLSASISAILQRA